MQVTWSHGANSKAQLAQALASDVHMLEADILLRGQGTPAQTDIPVMAHPPQTDSDNTFQEWLDAALESKKGLKLDFKSIGSVAPSLRTLKDMSGLINRPVWLNADILPGPNTANPGVNAREFIDTVNQIFPECTLSLGWTTGFHHDQENEGYTQQMVEEMHSYCRDLTQPVTFPIRNSLLGLPGTMESLTWLLSQSERYSITVWTGLYDFHRIYDLVKCRNAFSHQRVYYDLPKQQEDDFLETMQRHVSKVNPLSFFPLVRRDALLLTWSHGTNHREKLAEALRRRSNIIEADVILGDQNQPIMGRPTDTGYDITLEDWLSAIMAADHDVAVKLTFHTTEAVVPTMTMLRQNMSKIDFPVIINAGVLAPSYGSEQPALDPDLVFNPTYGLYPNGATTSIQFNGITLQGGITREMARNTHALAQRLTSPVTFTILAAVAVTSWPNVKWLLELSEGYTLTLYEGELSLDPVDLFRIRNDFDWSRVLYDITTEKATELARMSETGGSLVNVFQANYRIYGRDALSITWANGVNSREALEEAIGAYREMTMLEADVDIRSDGVPIMSNNASATGGDVMTLEEWLDVVTITQGIMLEFHSVNSVVPALEIFRRRYEDLKSPIMLKAKIPGLFTKETFIDPIINMFPHVSIVFALSPASPSQGYSRAQVEEVAQMCSNLTQVVVFSVDARQVRRSWDNLSWLLDQSPLYHLYIWAGWSEPETYRLDVADLVFVRNNLDHSRVYYDLIPRVMEGFHKALEET
ncbi:protein FAM151A-like isoform X3 [Branchiostoma floridae x Branchiostoma belcheri]